MLKIIVKGIWRETRGKEPLLEFLLIFLRAMVQLTLGLATFGALFFLLYLLVNT